MFKVSTRVDTSGIAAVVKSINDKTRAAVDESAREIQTRAYALAPKDTTSLANSIYVNNGEESDYPQRTAAARNVNKAVVILEEIDPEFIISLGDGGDPTHVAVVGVAASHGIHQEYGTRFMGPQPYLTPATEGVEGAFVGAMSKVAG